MVFAPADFFTELRKRLKQRLPSELRDFRTTRGRGRLMKVYFGEPAFHYEAWHHTGAGRLEVGLHFEPWDRGWTRLYETVPAARLDDVVLDDAVECMAAYVVALQPLLHDFMRRR